MARRLEVVSDVSMCKKDPSFLRFPFAVDEWIMDWILFGMEGMETFCVVLESFLEEDFPPLFPPLLPNRFRKLGGFLVALRDGLAGGAVSEKLTALFSCTGAGMEVLECRALDCCGLGCLLLIWFLCGAAGALILRVGEGAAGAGVNLISPDVSSLGLSFFSSHGGSLTEKMSSSSARTGVGCSSSGKSSLTETGEAVEVMSLVL